MTKQQWYDIGRIVHLIGGLRAINNPGAEVIIPLGSKSPSPTFSIENYYELPSTLRSLGFDIVGVEYYETSEQVKGYYPPTWYPLDMSRPTCDVSLKAQEIWPKLANAGFQKGDIELMDLCSRIAFEVKACNQRLRQLSEAYNVELWSLCEQQKFSPGRAETLNSFSIYLETHDLLRELCTLRDYLAEFVANFVLANSLSSKQRIRLMNSLMKQIRKTNLEDSPIATEINSITNEQEDGWLARLSAYRDLVVHYVPIGQAAKREFVVQRFLPNSKIKNLPSIYFPIPYDPYALKKTRSKGSPFTTVSDWLESSKENTTTAPDALDYCAYSVENMMALAYRIAKESPIAPQSLTFTTRVDA